MIESYVREDHEYGVEDVGNPLPGIMQVYFLDGKPEMVDFLCPCGCGSTCPTHVVPIKEKAKPEHKDRRWGFDLATLTLVPSVRYLGGCKAHFTITNGKVTMHGDSGR